MVGNWDTELTAFLQLFLRLFVIRGDCWLSFFVWLTCTISYFLYFGRFFGGLCWALFLELEKRFFTEIVKSVWRLVTKSLFYAQVRIRSPLTYKWLFYFMFISYLQTWGLRAPCWGVWEALGQAVGNHWNSVISDIQYNILPQNLVNQFYVTFFVNYLTPGTYNQLLILSKF